MDEEDELYDLDNMEEDDPDDFEIFEQFDSNDEAYNLLEEMHHPGNSNSNSRITDKIAGTLANQNEINSMIDLHRQQKAQQELFEPTGPTSSFQGSVIPYTASLQDIMSRLESESQFLDKLHNKLLDHSHRLHVESYALRGQTQTDSTNQNNSNNKK
ncbi:hypothetical protein CYY_009858 [Polysphondylium violaceum]|uniref:Uncharacterized protein n=1 Tax=Polysphondylium violaceum TaxID=133409 RepID=A0A8J4UVM6_9MYCE|nr:hypothetical protein CYY_009858 [Polysphondylium violaceum]